MEVLGLLSRIFSMVITMIIEEWIQGGVFLKTTITPAEAKQRLENENNSLLLDVRTHDEYRSAHIPGSKLIPLNVLEKEAPLQISDRNVLIIVYCQSGGRSGMAADLLLKLGYTNVYNLGGIGQWPYGTESGG